MTILFQAVKALLKSTTLPDTDTQPGQTPANIGVQFRRTEILVYIEVPPLPVQLTCHGRYEPVRSSRGRRGKRLKILYSLYLAVPHSCHAGLCPAYRTMRITLPLVQPLGVYDIAPSGVSVSSANVPVLSLIHI